MEHEKHGCVWHPLRPRGRRPHGELHRSTSKLAVYLHVHRLTSGLKCNTVRVMAVTGQEADERVGEECAPNRFLRFLFIPFGQAPYAEACVSPYYKLDI